MRFIMFRLSYHPTYPCTIVLILGVVMSSCAVLSPVVNPGEVLFQDDFSRPDSGWDRYSDELYTANYVEDAYQLKVDGTNMFAWGRPDLDFENVLIRVEGIRISGPVDSVYGVICRYIDRKNFHFFVISSDGYAGIGRFSEGQKELLSHEALLPTDAIGPMDEQNLIQAACVEHDLTLWINGKVVAEATTSDLSQGDVGLIVGSYDQGGVEIQFDNFSTLMP
jgi:hypothetical protein